jgi:hypothetical protein
MGLFSYKVSRAVLRYFPATTSKVISDLDPLYKLDDMLKNLRKDKAARSTVLRLWMNG